MTETLLVATSVVKRFRGIRAVDGVTLHVNSGEIVGLIGPNGSGKTTLINLISGVLRPTEGDITFEGARISGLSPHRVARAGVGRTFQQIRLFRDLSIRENVDYGAVAKSRTPKEARVDHLLSLLSLTGVADRTAGTLSYGDQRRVEIARALAGGPRLLLLDEPAAGMNEEESESLRQAIHTVHDELECAVLIVEHDLNLMMRLCDRLHVLAEGHTISEGTPQFVRSDPRVVTAYFGTGHVPGDDNTPPLSGANDGPAD